MKWVGWGAWIRRVKKVKAIYVFLSHSFWGVPRKSPLRCAPEWAEEERGNIKVLCDERRYKKERGKAQMES